jgi:hypothetical protein
VIRHSAPGTEVHVIPVGENDQSCCLLAARWVFPVSPVEFLFDFASGGHGVYYVKPILIELRSGKPAERRELAYGGKADESYYINRVTPSGDVVHLLGLRQQEKRAWGPREVKSTPVILHHTAYHLKKKKVTQTDPIYAETPRGERVGAMWHRYDYGDFSMDAAGDDVFVAFSWEKLSHPTNQSGEQRVESNILYWESCGGRTSKAEKVADGFLPIVKADPLGNVRLLCVNQNSNVTHRVKRNGVWEEEKVLFNGVDAKPYFDTIAGAFDKNNRLHVVYPSTGSLVHAIVNPD